MSADMQKVRDRLVVRLGASYGRAQFMWLCQKYNVFPTDEVVPAGMLREVKWN